MDNFDLKLQTTERVDVARAIDEICKNVSDPEKLEAILDH